MMYFCYIDFVQAQNNTLVQPQLVVSGIRPANLDWSDQQNVFAFSDATLPSGQVINDFDTWYRFNVANSQITQSNIWPLQPATPIQIEDQVSPGTLLFRSPNGQYFIFVAPSTNPQSLFEKELKVYDAANASIISTGVSAGGVTDTVGTLDVIWGTDTEFIIKTLPEEGGVPTLPNLYFAMIQGNAVTIQLISEVNYEGQTLIIYDVIDLASDGRHILIQAGIFEEFSSFLAIWNLHTPSDLIIIPEAQINRETLLDARFTTVDGSEFVFVDDQRLGRYNVMNETSSNINSEVNGQRYRFAEFSDNGERLALANNDAVYWLDLHSIQGTQTPTLTETFIYTATSTPTATETPTFTPTATDTYTATSTPTATITPTAAPYQNLLLTSMCSPDPTSYRVWRVRNSNAYPVNFTWDVYGTTQTGSGTVPAANGSTPGEAFFQTVTVAGANTTRIFVNGTLNNTKASTTRAC
jgi:hypothetical protein